MHIRILTSSFHCEMNMLANKMFMKRSVSNSKTTEWAKHENTAKDAVYILTRRIR